MINWMGEGKRGRREEGIKNDQDTLSLTKWKITSKSKGSAGLLEEDLSQRNEYILMEFGASDWGSEESSQVHSL